MYKLTFKPLRSLQTVQSAAAFSALSMNLFRSSTPIKAIKPLTPTSLLMRLPSLLKP